MIGMDEDRGSDQRPMASAAVAGAAAIGVTLTGAGVLAYAFDPARAGEGQMLGALGGFYAGLTALALYRLHRRGELRRAFLVARGDITMAAVSAGALYAAARVARALLAGSPYELWIMRIYLQIGDLSGPGSKLLGAAVFAVAALEVIGWRGLVMRSQQDAGASGPRAAAITTLLYAAAHLPTLSLLRMPGAGLNPLLVTAALGCGMVWSLMVLRSGRLVPAVLAHAVFTWSLIEFPLWQPG